jgi:2-phosphosulfolactate phosphatase
MQSVRVHYLPQLVAEHELAGSTVVVVDLLRASTTICQALASGACEVIPFVEVTETLQAAGNCERADVLLGGERGGRAIEGFDLGNSPGEYTADVVLGRRIFFTTTNGTRALQHSRSASRVLIGAFVNLSAVVASVKTCPRLDILCAGTRGRVTGEDVLAAGAIVHRLIQLTGHSPAHEAANRARCEWERLIAAAQSTGRSWTDQLADDLRYTLGGRNLLAIGHDDDLVNCAQIDCLDVVPELDVPAWRIYLP